MLYYRLLSNFNYPATAQDVHELAKKEAPDKAGNIQTVRAALAYLVKTNRAIRVGHGRYEAVKTHEDEVIKLLAENRKLRERLRVFEKAFMITIEAHGFTLKDFEVPRGDK